MLYFSIDNSISVLSFEWEWKKIWEKNGQIFNDDIGKQLLLLIILWLDRMKTGTLQEVIFMEQEYRKEYHVVWFGFTTQLPCYLE